MTLRVVVSRLEDDESNWARAAGEGDRIPRPTVYAVPPVRPCLFLVHRVGPAGIQVVGRFQKMDKRASSWRLHNRLQKEVTVKKENDERCELDLQPVDDCCKVRARDNPRDRSTLDDTLIRLIVGVQQRQASGAAVKRSWSRWDGSRSSPLQEGSTKAARDGPVRERPNPE